MVSPFGPPTSFYAPMPPPSAALLESQLRGLRKRVWRPAAVAIFFAVLAGGAFALGAAQGPSVPPGGHQVRGEVVLTQPFGDGTALTVRRPAGEEIVVLPDDSGVVYRVGDRIDRPVDADQVLIVADDEIPWVTIGLVLAVITVLPCLNGALHLWHIRRIGAQVRGCAFMPVRSQVIQRQASIWIGILVFCLCGGFLPVAIYALFANNSVFVISAPYGMARRLRNRDAPDVRGECLVPATDEIPLAVWSQTAGLIPLYTRYFWQSDR